MNQAITIKPVYRIIRRGVGDVYYGSYPILRLHEAMKNGLVRYAPKYQRGFKRKHEDEDPNSLYDINNPALDIKAKRAASIAAKYLLGLSDAPIEGNTRLFNTDIVWNARSGEGYDKPNYNEEDGSVTVYSNITIPDSGHRHYAYYLMMKWWIAHKEGKDTKIPRKITLAKGHDILGVEVEDLLDKFDPSNFEEHSVLVKIYNLHASDEGKFFDELNMEAKKVSTAAAIRNNPESSPATKFATALKDRSTVLSEEQIEMNYNTVSKTSDKLISIAAMVAAAAPFAKELQETQRKSPKGYNDLIDFFCAYYEEWSIHYPVFAPEASLEERQLARDTSYATTNIMVYPMFKLAFEMWDHYHKRGLDWREENGWKDALESWSNDIEEYDPFTGEDVRASVMSKDNAGWKGKIVMRKIKGDEIIYTLNSTSSTRKAAEEYLRSIAVADGVHILKQGE